MDDVEKFLNEINLEEEEVDFFPFDFEGFCNILAVLQENQSKYYRVQDFISFVPKKTMKEWNLLKRMKKTLICYFPFISFTMHETITLLPIDLQDIYFIDAIMEIIIGDDENLEIDIEKDGEISISKNEIEPEMSKKTQGRKGLYEKYPVILELIQEKFGLADTHAHTRRRDSISYVNGVSLGDLKKHVEEKLREKFNIILDASPITYRRYLSAPSENNNASIRYLNLIEAKLSKGSTDLSFDSIEQHWARTQITYLYSILSHSDQQSLIISLDDKAKVDIGKQAVSKYVKGNKFYLKDKQVRLPDHDFPLAQRYKITPSGYLQMIPNKELLTENEYGKPIHKKLFMYNRPFKFFSSSPKTHYQDLLDLLSSHENNFSSLALICDNGVDVTPNSWLVIYYMGFLWKSLNLDHLFICSNAPGASKFNEIERHFGELTKKLGQVLNFSVRTLQVNQLKVEQKNTHLKH